MVSRSVRVWALHVIQPTNVVVSGQRVGLFCDFHLLVRSSRFALEFPAFPRNASLFITFRFHTGRVIYTYLSESDPICVLH